MRGWLRQTAGGLPAPFWYLWGGSLINRLGGFVLIFLAIYVTQERGFTQGQAGVVLGLYGVGAAAGTMVGGVLADRWGRRATLLAAHLGTAAAMVNLGLAREYWQLAAGALLLGAFAEAARPAFAAMVVDVVPDRDRLRAFSLSYWAINLGFAGSAVLAGLVAELDYLLLFVADAATTLVTAAIVFAKVPESRPVVTAAGRGPAAAIRPAPGPGLGAVFADRVFLTFVGLNLLGALVMMQHMSTLPITMTGDGHSPATFGWVIALNGVLIVAGQLFVPRLIAGRGRSHVLALAAAVMGAGFGLTAFADAAWLYAVTVLIWTAGEMLHAPSNSALIAELAPAELRGRYQGVLALAWALASAGAPMLGGYVLQLHGGTVLWLGCAAVGGLAAAGHLMSGPARERRAAQLRAASTPAEPAVPDGGLLPEGMGAQPDATQPSRTA